ncbi:GNAT family N-acetyltransferase [Pedobacter sp.]|uniref:GNAT family N-acetyltransferase n=1 Tax=Pedobacter sp. TaxID=1411316 RepID=UPI003D7F1EC2
MNETVYLRPLALEDAKISYKWRNNLEIWKHSRFKPIYCISEEMEEKWLADALQAKDQMRFAICIESTHEYIGNIQLIKITENDAEFHLFIGEPKWWGRGLGRLATVLILQYAFIEQRLQYISLEVHKDNLPAINIYNKLGFKDESYSYPFNQMKLTIIKYFQLLKQQGNGKILTLEEKEAWISYVERAINVDFYHSWTYHKLDESGTPLLYVYEEGSDFIAFPFLKRAINDTEYFDLSSVFGYNGPISNMDFNEIKPDFANRLMQSLQEYLAKEKIVSIFMRLHPFYNQDLLLRKFGGVWNNGQIVAIDLAIPLNVQRQNYKKVYSKIKQLKRLGFYFREATTLADIKLFVCIYKENMSRLSASSAYVFTEDYCVTLLNSKEYEAKLYFICNENDDPICGTIIGFNNQIVQGHLIATREEYRDLSPAKFMVDEISIIAREKGMKYYNLGGGLGYKEDSLYKWKTTFSKLTFDFKTWRYIVNKQAYFKILKELNIDAESTIDHFPLYRSQNAVSRERLCKSNTY